MLTIGPNGKIANDVKAQTVEITGTEVTLSNNYDVRSFDLQTIKRKTTK